jgi:hypothetical protein
MKEMETLEAMTALAQFMRREKGSVDSYCARGVEVEVPAPMKRLLVERMMCGLRNGK